MTTEADIRPGSHWEFNDVRWGDSGHYDEVIKVEGGMVHYVCHDSLISDTRGRKASIQGWLKDMREVAGPPITPVEAEQLASRYEGTQLGNVAAALKPTHWRVTATASSEGTSGTATWKTNTKERAQEIAATLSAMGFDTKVTALRITEQELT